MVVAAALWSWGMYRGIRWALGHKKALGRWWRRDEFKALLQHIYDEHRSGRILEHEELKLINQHQYGKEDFRLHDKARGGYL
jgi:hypothetical protein